MIQRKAGDYKNIVIVGAGPAGLEAARVSAERGHHVEVFEAAPHAGGQIRLLIRHARRKEMQSIIDWRLERCESRGVKFHFNSWADAAALLDQQPDVVIIATGGVPNTNVVNGSDELVASSWDIISGDVDIADDVLLYDDNGGHPGLQAAEVIAEKGARLEILTPERLFSPEIGGVNYVAYATTFHKCGVTITINKRLLAVQRDGALLKATIGSDYDTRIESRLISQVVVEHGTLPLDDLYVRLRPESINRGEVDYRALMSRQEQRVYRNPKGKYHLYRIGDAVASRNIHAAIFDALRLCISL